LDMQGARGRGVSDGASAEEAASGRMVPTDPMDVSEGDYSDDAFDESGGTMGHSSREGTQAEKDVFDQMLSAVQARRGCRDVMAAATHGSSDGDDREPSPPRHATAESSESLGSVQSGRSGGSITQNATRFQVIPPQCSGRQVAQAVADVSYARGASAPVLGTRSGYLMDDGQSEQSEGGGREGCRHPEEEPPEEVVTISYPSYSWHETLARFPSLLRLYPLAECNEGAMEDELFPVGGEGGAHEGEAAAGTASGTGVCTRKLEELAVVQEQMAVGSELRAPPGLAAPAAAGVSECEEEQPLLQEAAAHLNNDPAEVPEETEGTWPEGTGIGVCTPPPCTPVRVGAGPAQATPRSVPSRAGSRTRQMHSNGHQSQWQGWSSADLAAAWAEVEEIRQDLAQREQELAAREFAVRRAEARNQATARELSELRHRLDDYGEELEEGVAALTLQQNALREERRQTLELQARARRMCAAAVRDDVVASKFREWERIPWTPMPTMGGM